MQPSHIKCRLNTAHKVVNEIDLNHWNDAKSIPTAPRCLNGFEASNGS